MSATDAPAARPAGGFVARTLASLRRQGWQPKRSIVLALWDGEEFGLIGSTEWVEKHQEELERKAELSSLPTRDLRPLHDREIGIKEVRAVE